MSDGDGGKRWLVLMAILLGTGAATGAAIAIALTPGGSGANIGAGVLAMAAVACYIGALIGSADALEGTTQSRFGKLVHLCSEYLPFAWAVAVIAAIAVGDFAPPIFFGALAILALATIVVCLTAVLTWRKGSMQA